MDLEMDFAASPAVSTAPLTESAASPASLAASSVTAPAAPETPLAA